MNYDGFNIEKNVRIIRAALITTVIGALAVMLMYISIELAPELSKPRTDTFGFFQSGPSSEAVETFGGMVGLMVFLVLITVVASIFLGKLIRKAKPYALSIRGDAVTVKCVDKMGTFLLQDIVAFDVLPKQSVTDTLNAFAPMASIKTKDTEYLVFAIQDIEKAKQIWNIRKSGN